MGKTKLCGFLRILFKKFHCFTKYILTRQPFPILISPLRFLCVYIQSWFRLEKELPWTTKNQGPPDFKPNNSPVTVVCPLFPVLVTSHPSVESQSWCFPSIGVTIWPLLERDICVRISVSKESKHTFFFCIYFLFLFTEGTFKKCVWM